MRTARADSLTWDVTADVGQFQEALKFFGSRVVMTGDEALALDTDARRRAFWIGGGLQLTQVQRVFDEISKALESGEDYAAFRQRVLADVAIKPGHLDTVFRNATQRSYAAGRWEQMQAAKDLRPYVMFDAVLDSRSSDICGDKIDGKIVAIDDPFLRTNSPPRHHRCRTGLRSLRAKDAERRGITPKSELDDFPPAAPGFGVIPTDAPVWKPDKKNHDAKLVEELEAKENRPPKVAKPKKPPPEHDPAHWLKHYSQTTDYTVAGYGEAAPAVAWGRAMLERGLDRPVGELVSELRQLQSAGLPGLDTSFIRYLERMPPERTLRTHPLPARFRGYLALAEHTKAIKPGGAFPIPGDAPNLNDARAFYELLLDNRVRRPDYRVIVHPEPDFRAYADPRTREVHLAANEPTQVVVHEFAHTIEYTDTKALNRSIDFLTARTRGEQARKLSELTGDTRYGENEIARRDKFFDAYVGKDYQRHATEVTSMAYEQIARPGGVLADGTPVGPGLEQLSQEDPELLLFALGQLAGR